MSSATCMQVTLRYSAKAPGVLTCPLQLHVMNGRRLRLDVAAECVAAAGYPAVQLPGSHSPNADSMLVLKPVAIGALPHLPQVIKHCIFGVPFHTMRCAI